MFSFPISIKRLETSSHVKKVDVNKFIKMTIKPEFREVSYDGISKYCHLIQGTVPE